MNGISEEGLKEFILANFKPGPEDELSIEFITFSETKIVVDIYGTIRGLNVTYDVLTRLAKLLGTTHINLSTEACSYGYDTYDYVTESGFTLYIERQL